MQGRGLVSDCVIDCNIYELRGEKLVNSTPNGNNIIDPWSQTGRDATPFDQDFYLILNVAVGGTNGWFEDGIADKPWVNESPTATLDFWQARHQWYLTWKNGMEVRSVKMWQQEGFNGCSAGKNI